MAGPTLTFKKKSGGTFKKKFKSISTAKRAIKGWTAAGGKMAKKKR